MMAVLSSRFEAINEERGRVLIRTLRFDEARDFGVAVFDKNGATQVRGVPCRIVKTNHHEKIYPPISGAP